MERLQKVLAKAGVASRRKCEELILNGKVAVNGEVINLLGVKVNPAQDRITVDGEPITISEDKIYILLYKPEGYLTTVADSRGRKTVIDLLPDNLGRIFPVGRLDLQTSGLLLLTNDGDMTFKLTHPKHQIDKTYQVLIKGHLRKEAIDRLEKGIELEDGITAPSKVKVLEHRHDSTLLSITIHEGKNRQVRRMFKAVGYHVLALKRTSFGFLTLNGLQVGEHRKLTQKEIKRLGKG